MYDLLFCSDTLCVFSAIGTAVQVGITTRTHSSMLLACTQTHACMYMYMYMYD